VAFIPTCDYVFPEGFVHVTEADEEFYTYKHSGEYFDKPGEYIPKGEMNSVYCIYNGEIVTFLLPSSYVTYRYDSHGLIYSLKNKYKKIRRVNKKKTINQLLLQLGIDANWICLYCQNQGSEKLGPDGRIWHIDHFYPKARGGDNEHDNLVLSCATCNLRKHAKLASEILAEARLRLCAMGQDTHGIQ